MRAGGRHHPDPREEAERDEGHAAAAVGAASHYVAVPEGRDPEGCDVRAFGAFTADLYALADWLTRCGIQTVAMESTGVYWIPLFELLSERGFEVKLVDPRQFKSVPGRKSDVLDCQWIQQAGASDRPTVDFLEEHTRPVRSSPRVPTATGVAPTLGARGVF